ncbi:MAG: type II secretion system major pseudopilin GspG [Gammaproteobacteria bacterium]
MKQNKNNSKSYGFTLIELLVVLVILGLLSGLVGPKVMKHFGESKVKTAKLQVEELASALDMYKLDTDSYPTSSQGLRALVEEPSNVAGWNGPYLRKNFVPKDPWKREYQYKYPGEHGEFDIYSYGADNSQGGEKDNRDVVSWN